MSRMNQNRRFDDHKPKDMKGTFARLFGYMKPYRFRIILVIVLAVIGVFCTAFAPKILASATNEIAAGIGEAFGGNGFGINMGKLSKILLLLASVYFCSAFFRYIQNYIMTGVAQRTMYDLRKSIDHKLAKLPLNYFDTNTFGDVLSRVTNDVDTVSNSMQQSLDQIITSVSTIILVFIMMLSISWQLTLIGLITLPFSFLISMLVVKKSQGFFRGQQRALGAVNGYVEEMYSGHQVIQAFGKENDTVAEFNNLNHTLYKNAWKAQFVSSIIMPCVQFMSNIGYVLVAVVGGYGVVRGSLLVGDIQAFIQYLRQFSQPINQTANIANILQSTAAAGERIFQFLDATEEAPDTANPVILSEVKGDVVFEHVKFGYSDDTILIQDLNLSVKAGQKVAIVGPTGAGKTTLINLLLRFYDIKGGRIMVDGVDIRDMSRVDLRNDIAIVLQDAWLFTGSIRENIRYGKLDASDEDVKKAAKAAHAHGFIKTLPGGYDMVINEEASNISQGQRQLITIARALLSDPPILILDEATSSVDTRTELLIQKAMNTLMENRTSFVIAHRLSTIKDADMILVMREGDIVEKGTHQQLLAQGGFYADLYNSQFAENNLA